MNRHILFVDDEPMVLRGIERSLRNMRQHWQMEFAESGPMALEIMARSNFDVVITDMRMPGMDGAQLLREVKSRFPETVRMVLSGQSDDTTIFRSIRNTHQYLSKPCDVDEIKGKLAQAFSLCDMLDNPALKQTVSRLESIPSRPSAYGELHKLLQSPGADVSAAGRLMSEDMGMTAKVLQLTNSAFLGPARVTSNPRKAAAQLGLEHLATLALSADVFSVHSGAATSLMEEVWQESTLAAVLAGEIASHEGCDEFTVESAYVAGLLHDIGKLVLATECEDEYGPVTAKACNDEISLVTGERELFGCTHAQVGGYLLGLWGLPGNVVEAVAWHHDPAKRHPAGFSPLIAVHVAHAHLESKTQAAHLDERLLNDLGLADKLPAWEALCRKAQERRSS
ncbi:MAG TPA: HDOD domain-containing protein [Terriglobales bacterium]|jgi:HD-like signal output (HDOD) protein